MEGQLEFCAEQPRVVRSSVLNNLESYVRRVSTWTTVVYLVKGAADSEDRPLNIARSTPEL